MNFKKIEASIVEFKNNQLKLDNIKVFLLNWKAKLDYFLSRFLEDFDEMLELNSIKHVMFYTSKSQEYTQVNRLIGLVHAYGR